MQTRPRTRVGGQIEAGKSDTAIPESRTQEERAGTFESSVDEILFESIFLVLGILGDSVRESILYFEKSRYSIGEEDIPRNVDRFMKSLRDLLGYGAGRVVEKLAIQSFAEKFHLSSSQIAGKTLGDIANLVRQSSLQQDLG